MTDEFEERERKALRKFLQPINPDPVKGMSQTLQMDKGTVKKKVRTPLPRSGPS